MKAMKLRFFVPGIPAPGGSKTPGFSKKTGKSFCRPASKKTKPWMATVAGVVRSQYDGELLQGALSLSMEFRLLRPKGHYGSGRNAAVLKPSSPAFPTVKPDLTKLVRSTEDALTGILWRDDTQVAFGDYRKLYVDKDPGVVIFVSMLEVKK